MRETKDFVKGKNDAERFKSINQTLKHFARRLQKKIIVTTPSSPIFKTVYAPETDGTVMRMIFPIAGRILSSCIFVAYKEEKEPVVFEVLFTGKTRNTTEIFEVKNKPLVFNINFPVFAGERMILSVREPEKVKGIWVGLLYEVDPMALSKKSYMLDQLEAMLEDAEDVKN